MKVYAQPHPCRGFLIFFLCVQHWKAKSGPGYEAMVYVNLVYVELCWRYLGQARCIKSTRCLLWLYRLQLFTLSSVVILPKLWVGIQVHKHVQWIFQMRCNNSNRRLAMKQHLTALDHVHILLEHCIQPRRITFSSMFHTKPWSLAKQLYSMTVYYAS